MELQSKEKELKQLYELRAYISVIAQRNCEYRLKALSDEDILTEDTVNTAVKNMLEDTDQMYEALKERTSDLYAKLRKKSRLFFKFSRKSLPRIDNNSSVWILLASIGYLFYTIFFRLLLDIVSFPFLLISPIRIKYSKIARAMRKDAEFDRIVDKKAYGNIDKAELEKFDNESVSEIIRICDTCKYEYRKYDKTEMTYKFSKFCIFMPSTIQFVYDAVKDIWKANRKAAYEEISKQRESVTKSEIIAKAVEKYYAPLVSKQEWENLDLIIYYLEEKADTLENAKKLFNVEKNNINIEKESIIARDKIIKKMYDNREDILNEINLVVDGLDDIVMLKELKEALFNQLKFSSIELVKMINAYKA